MTLTIRLLLALTILFVLGCSEERKDKGAEDEVARHHELPAVTKSVDGNVIQSVALDPQMQKKLLALAENRSKWFWTTDITKNKEQLYNSWSLVCQKGTTLEYANGAKWFRDRVVEGLDIELEVLQKTKRSYKVASWSSPWAYVAETYEPDPNNPNYQLYIIESGEWRYHDC
jgi:hypothetical protein